MQRFIKDELQSTQIYINSAFILYRKSLIFTFANIAERSDLKIKRNQK